MESLRSGRSIRSALLGLVAIPSLALILALAHASYRQYAASVAEAYNTARVMRSLSVGEAEQYLEQARALLDKLAQRPQIQALDGAHCDPLLAEFKQLHDAYADIITLDAKGQMVCSGRPRSAEPASHAGLPQRTDHFSIGKPALVAGRWEALLAHPIKNKAGQQTGVVAIAADLLNYRPLLSRKDLPPRTLIGMVNSDGIIVARSENAEQRVGRPAMSQTTEQILREREGALRARDYQGIQRYFAFAPVAGSDWILYVALDESAALAPVIELALWRLGLVCLLLLVLGTVTALLLRRIARPVESISTTMALVGAGGVDARAPVQGPRELRQIAVQLNAMLDARQQAEAQLRLSEERFRTAFETSPDALIITRLQDGRYMEFNEGFSRLTGWSRYEVIGRTVEDVSIWRYAQDRPLFVQALKANGRCENFEADFVAKDGRVFRGLISAQLMTLDGEACILSITRDISARKAAEEQIRDLSFSDPLTGLANRRLFMDRLNQALLASVRHQRLGALLFVDLDDFKTINETLGHEQGDLFLREVAQRLRHGVRDGDTVARLGGDDFVVMLENLSDKPDEAAAQAEVTGEKLLNLLSMPFAIEGLAPRRSASIGITLFGIQHEDLAEPLKRAELAMYQAKTSGRNCLRFFDPQMQAIVSARVALEAALRQAVAARQFVLYYQAQVTEQGQVTGAEVLVRWQDPLRGMVSPAEFIPLAEETGLILPIGQWVLETACARLARWAGDAVLGQLTIAVNVSARQLYQPDFVHQVLAVLQRSGADPSRLKLEITESMLVTHVEDVIAKMNALKSRGVRFSLDDFGTGYSSLSYLKRLPLSQLKIDQGFVRDILLDPNDAAIAKMVIALADSMGLTVIAEGVETVAQRDFLASLGCRHYQGYLFGRPMPVEQFQALWQQVHQA